MKTARSPFLFGSQYYRAPTPDESCWEADHARMAALGFNSVKYWVQWRWSHRRGGVFVFDDVLRLMDIAHRHGLAVTLNVIFDVAPHWLYEEYPDAKPVMNCGRVIEPEAVAHRQIGGSPGPSFFHAGARAEREKFLAATVAAFKDHPALDMWDIWNEPELAFNQRTPNLDTLADYNPHAIAAFRVWLERKYSILEKLNAVWGRCYEAWSEVEAPRTAQTIQDFIDWREFHLDALTDEARWRFAAVRSLDPRHVVFLHTVPNLMWCWNSVSGCADDFALAEMCDLYAASYNGGGQHVAQLTSPAAGKIVYNTETHINFGVTTMHPGRVDLPKLLDEFLPQIGAGIRGFQFWQFRAETLGFEAPAWGVVKADGSDRPVTLAAAQFWEKLAPYADALARCPSPPTEVGVWKSRLNEIFHFAIHGKLQPLIESVCPYVDALYAANIPYRVVDDRTLGAGRLEGLRFLILPSPYYLTQAEIDALSHWVEAGGILWSEAHLGAYNGTTGRHSAIVPGGGLAAAWGVREVDSTSSYRLDLEQSQAFAGAMSEDVKKALLASGTSGAKFFPIQTPTGATIWGAERYAELSHRGGEVLGSFDGRTPTLVRQPVGRGAVYYHGTNLGEGSAKERGAFRNMLAAALDRAGIVPTLHAQADEPGSVHLDRLQAPGGDVFLVIRNGTKMPQTLRFRAEGRVFRGLWTGLELRGDGSPQTVPAMTCDLLVGSQGNRLHQMAVYGRVNTHEDDVGTVSGLKRSGHSQVM